VHHLHLWSLDGEQHVLTVHLRLNANADSQQLMYYKMELSELLQLYHLAHTTIEFESPQEVCRDEASLQHASHDHSHEHNHQHCHGHSHVHADCQKHFVGEAVQSKKPIVKFVKFNKQ
jgi:cobalt-zinc-cadmium efflux system protein